MQNEKCTLVNIYAPKTAQATFLSSLTLLLSKYADIPMLLGGDFNTVYDPELDYSGRPLPADRQKKKKKKSLETFSHLFFSDEFLEAPRSGE